MDEAGQQQQKQGQKWFQDWRWVASIAALLFGIAGGAFAITSVETGSEINDQTEILEQIETISGQNAAELEQLERNQAGIEELLQFVRRAQTEGGDDVVTREEIQAFFQLLCASTDPIRNQACDELAAQQQGASP